MPAITQKRWGEAVSADGCLRIQLRVGAAGGTLAPAQGDDVVIPIKPTHMNTELLPIFKEAGGKGRVAQRLPAFTTVTQVKSEKGWAPNRQGWKSPWLRCRSQIARVQLEGAPFEWFF